MGNANVLRVRVIGRKPYRKHVCPKPQSNNFQFQFYNV